jgi:hypothetical protein
MMKLLSGFFLLLLAAMSFAAEPPAFKQLFSEHLKKGTLLHHTTDDEFRAKGWGRFYQEAIANEFSGTPVDRLRMVVALRGNAPRVGQKLSLLFRLFNDSEKETTIWDGGNCGVTHAAVFIVVDEQGNLIPNLGMGKVGGPHCFCNQAEVVIPPYSARWLSTRTDSDSVMAWAPKQPGKYIIIGTYARPTKDQPERRILSKPLVLDVK